MTPIQIIAQIALAALIGAMQQAIQHWFPWRLFLRRDLPRVAAYIIGTLAYLLPLSILFIHWQQQAYPLSSYTYLAAVWACVIASGLTVLIVRAIDWGMDRITRSYEGEEREQ